MINLPITQESPKTALFFGLVAVITGALLLAIVGGSIVPELVLALFSIFWIITGSIALWFGWRYLRIRHSKR